MGFTEEQERYFYEFIEILNRANALSSVILVGSWAEYLYEKENILSGFVSLAKTTDVDFLLNEDKNIKPENIIKPAQQKDFEYKEDYMSGTSKFWKKEFEIEFLTSQNGDGTKPVQRSSFGINAQPLTHIGFIRDNYITARHNGLDINIPAPEAYVLQKMIINDRRGVKAVGDRMKIERLLPYLNKSYFEKIYTGLHKKERSLVDKYIKEYCPEIREATEKDIVQIYKEIQRNSGNDATKDPKLK
ncbi:MAG: hypothetical protein IJ641_01485 [Lachnospiraceae bacterium]|nr:hypothetical protein [Lachnospiraceae bacterium]